MHAAETRASAAEAAAKAAEARVVAAAAAAAAPLSAPAAKPSEDHWKFREERWKAREAQLAKEKAAAEARREGLLRQLGQGKAAAEAQREGAPPPYVSRGWPHVHHSIDDGAAQDAEKDAAAQEKKSDIPNPKVTIPLSAKVWSWGKGKYKTDTSFRRLKPVRTINTREGPVKTREEETAALNNNAQATLNREAAELRTRLNNIE